MIANIIKKLRLFRQTDEQVKLKKRFLPQKIHDSFLHKMSIFPEVLIVQVIRTEHALYITFLPWKFYSITFGLTDQSINTVDALC